MKKIYLSFLSLMVAAGAMAQTAVTFNVNSLPIGPTDVLRVVGNFADPDNNSTVIENPAYSNWDPANSYGLMTDGDMDMIYSVTLNLAPGRYEFKFVNGNDWPFAENVPQTCTVEVNGNNNRQIMVGTEPTSYSVCYGQCADCDQNAIRVRVDMSTQDFDLDGVGGEPTTDPDVPQDIHPDGVHMNGSFVGWGNDAFVPLQDWDGNKIWEGLIVVVGTDPIEYKFINGPAWGFPDETISGPCGAGNGNRIVTITDPNTVLPVYCWNSCDPCSQPVPVTFQVDMNASCLDTSPGVNLMGTATDWGTGAPMADDNSDGIWTITLNLAPGNYAYKFRIGGNGWESNIADRQLTVVADTPQELPLVCFDSPNPCGSVIPPGDVTFQVRPGQLTLDANDVMWVMGNFTPDPWQTGALQMEDNDGDGTWTVTVPQVCFGTLSYKFRVGSTVDSIFTEETADFSAIGGCGVDNGTFSDNRQLVRTDGNPVTVCWTFDTCDACGPTAIVETQVAANLQVYPVPAEDQLNVAFNIVGSERVKLTLVNSLGQTVIEENLGMVNGQKLVVLNTENIAGGMYALTLTNGVQTQVVNVIVK
jgi:hypothetical protein